MIHANYRELLRFLKSQKVDAVLQKETNQIFFVLLEGQREFPVFMRIFEESELLQIIAFLLPALQKETYRETARLLHFINKELDSPGFGMDESAGVAFFRMMLPFENKLISPVGVEKYIMAAHSACKLFSPTIESVVSGAMTVDDLLKKAESMLRKSAEKQK